MSMRPPFTTRTGEAPVDARATDGDAGGIAPTRAASPWASPDGGKPEAEVPGSPERTAEAADPDRTVIRKSGPIGVPGDASARNWWGAPWNPQRASGSAMSGNLNASDPGQKGNPMGTGAPANTGYPHSGAALPPSGPLYGPPPGPPFGPVTPPPRRRRLVAAAVALAIVSAGVGGGVGAIVAGDARPVVSSSGLLRGTDSPGTSPAASGTVSAAAKEILPSVVTIAASSRGSASTGSGVIIRQDGYILTNNHVVSDATTGGTLSVTTQDGKEYSAKVVGTDPSSDLAVVKIDASGLKPATFGNSEALVVGELVVAVGSPLGLSGTVTSGIVSAIHRPVRTGDANVRDSEAILDAIQTDAPINPGNSGGPLVNSKGELIGINSAIATVSSGGFGNQQGGQAGNIGVGFAIPSNYAQSVAEDLISTGRASRPYLGVSISTAGASDEDPTGDGTGAQIQEVKGGGPAEQAGLRAGDVITKLGDRRITSRDGLIAAVRSYDIGSKVAVTYIRGDQTLTTEITLGEQGGS